ncbi:MAG TPA: SusC/RagA family TonB-linked outer membrane protein, partial [Daejeonella sp.]
MKKCLLFYVPLMMLFVIRGLAQTVVTGTVTDSNGETLPGVSVMIKGTTVGTTTDVEGHYSVNAPDNASTLVFSFIGMQSQEIVISDRKQIDVVLSEDAASLKEVVVIGYGSQSRSTITTSIAKLDAKVLEHSAMSNPGAALQGTISGLRVVNTTGQPGSVPNILLRGGASINNPGSPLVVVDGVVRTLSDVNPSDIESLQVLKDAASTAIYGARANNGVILITTKRGKAGVSNVTYTMKSGLNEQREAYDYLNARDFIYYNRMGINNTNLSRAPGGVAFVNPEVQAGYGTTASPNMYDIAKITNANRANFTSLISNGWQWMIDPISQKDTLIFKDYSGQISDAAFNQNPNTQDHNLSFTGGNDKSTFAATLNSYNEDGLVIGTKYQRFSGSLNGSYKIRNNLEVLAGTTYSESKAPSFLPGDIFFRTQAMQPTFKPFDESGNPSSGSSMSYGNPAYYQEKYIRKNSTRRSISNIGANWEIVPDLFLRAKANIYYTDYYAENFDKKIVYQTGNVDVSRASSANYSKSVQQQHNLTADYKKSINQHNFSFLLGGEYFDLSSSNLSATGKAAPTDDIYTLNAAVERTAINSGFVQNRMMSGFSRLAYDYNRKYLLSAVIRYDGVSSLTDHRWGAFPGVSLGWNVHEEDFFKSSSISRFITLLKPRMSYGVNGNIAGVGEYEVQGAYGIQTFYDAQAGYLNTGLINNGLRWEKSKSFDGGIELGLINNRVLLNLAYFRRTTTDLLTNLTLPGYTGFNSVRTNLG